MSMVPRRTVCPGQLADCIGLATAANGVPSIDQERCRHCGMCFRACRFGAVGRPYELYRLKDGRSHR